MSQELFKKILAFGPLDNGWSWGAILILAGLIGTILFIVWVLEP
jgi:hypothetical protein